MWYILSGLTCEVRALTRLFGVQPPKTCFRRTNGCTSRAFKNARIADLPTVQQITLISASSTALVSKTRASRIYGSRDLG